MSGESRFARSILKKLGPFGRDLHAQVQEERKTTPRISYDQKPANTPEVAPPKDQARNQPKAVDVAEVVHGVELAEWELEQYRWTLGKIAEVESLEHGNELPPDFLAWQSNLRANNWKRYTGKADQYDFCLPTDDRPKLGPQNDLTVLELRTGALDGTISWENDPLDVLARSGNPLTIALPKKEAGRTMYPSNDHIELPTPPSAQEDGRIVRCDINYVRLNAENRPVDEDTSSVFVRSYFVAEDGKWRAMPEDEFYKKTQGSD